MVNGHAVAYRAHRFECMVCGARLMSTMQFNGRECPGQEPETHCGYVTVQMSASAPGGAHCIHLGQGTGRLGGIGDNVCGNSRHARNPQTGAKYGFSVSGGWSDPDAWACEGCKHLLREKPASVSGMFASLFSGIATPPDGIGS